MIDFSQYKFGEEQKEEKRYFSNSKTGVFLTIAFFVLLLAVAELVIYFIIGFPKVAVVVFAIINGLLAITSLVLMFVSAKITKSLKRQGENYSKTQASASIYLLDFMIFLSITGIFIGRAINSSFIDAIFM